MRRENKQHKSKTKCVWVEGGLVIHSTVHRYTDGPLFSIYSPVIERGMGRLRLNGTDL